MGIKVKAVGAVVALLLGVGSVLVVVLLVTGISSRARADALVHSQCALLQTGPPTTRYVAVAGADVLTCATPSSPCQTVQYAVDVANDGDEIRVAAGVYTGVHARPAPPGYLGPSVVTQVVYVSKTVSVRGGYTTTDGFAGPPDSAANPTLLDAQGRGRVTVIAGAITATIEGLGITGGDASGLNGTALGHGCDSGGGVYVLSATAVLDGNRVFSNTASCGGGAYLALSGAILDGNVVQSNVAAGPGGGLYFITTTVVLSGNAVASNTAYSTGGMWFGFSAAALGRNTIVGNSSQVGWGGGAFLAGSSATFDGDVFSVNYAGGTGGGGLFLYGGLGPTQAALDGVTIVSNTVDSNAIAKGGGIHADWSWDVVQVAMTNTIIAHNQVLGDGRGSAIYSVHSALRGLHNTIAFNRGADGVYATGGTIILTNTIVASHSVAFLISSDALHLDTVLWYDTPVTVSVTYGFVPTGTVQNQYYGDPAFVDPDGGDYHISAVSAALDRGVDTGVVDDVDGEARPSGNGPDIGADELYPRAALRVTKSAAAASLHVGSPLTYFIRVTNTGNVTLTAVITDALPDHVTPAGTMTWVATLAPGGDVWSQVVPVDVETGYGGPLTNAVQVTTGQGAEGADSLVVTAICSRLYLPLVLRAYP